MSTVAEKQATASALLRCADDLEASLDGLDAMSAGAWSCPAGDGFESELHSQEAQLSTVADGLRAEAATLEAAAAAQLLAEEQAAAALAATSPIPADPAPPPPVPVGGTGPR